MKHYKDKSGKVWALDDDLDSPLEHLPKGVEEIVLAEAVAASKALGQAQEPELKDYFAKRLDALRKAREVVLNRLMGHMLSYSAAQVTSKLACVQARVALLDLPQYKDLLRAQTPAELDAAIDKHQVDIQAAMPEALHKVFAGIQL